MHEMFSFSFDLRDAVMFQFRLDSLIVFLDMDSGMLFHRNNRFFHETVGTVNKTGTSKVGAISKAQNAQKTFLKKNLKFLIFFSFRKCRIVPKNVKS